MYEKMGLDAAELILEIEESFGVRLPADRAFQMRTVGDLYALILQETGDQQRDPKTCITAATFYALRRALATHVEDVRVVRPRSEIHKTLPVRTRRSVWFRLANEMGLRFPALLRPWWLVLVASAAVGIVAGWVYLSLREDVGPEAATVVAALTLVVSTWIAVAVSRPLAVVPAATFRTYRGLVTQLVALNYATLSQRYHSWNASDVWNILQLIIVEQLGVKPDDVTPEASFVHDLGCA